MIEIIFIVILVASFAGMAVILYKRMPDLAKLPEQPIVWQRAAALKLKQGMDKMPVLKNFSYEIYLQKVLSRVRVLTLKTDNKTSGWLERLRKKQSQENGSANDKYWDELKKAKEGR